MAFSTSARFPPVRPRARGSATDRKSTRLNSSHLVISYAVFCLKKKKKKNNRNYIINLKIIIPHLALKQERKLRALLLSCVIIIYNMLTRYTVNFIMYYDCDLQR